MTSRTQDEGYLVIWLVRRLFRALGRKSDEMLQGHGISAADRAVMEFLFPGKALSVPEIAKEYDVSRQHVQVTVNHLIQSSLIEAKENPRHKKSPLMRLTTKGRNLFRKVLALEERAVSALFKEISHSDSHTTCRTLQVLLAEVKEEKHDENS